MARPIVHLVVGARPNFMKAAPLWRVLSQADWCEPRLIHTGQHYSPEMSDVFLSEFGLPTPHHALAVGAGSHAEQTAGVMVAYEKVAIEIKPNWVIVIGDVNSAVAAALAAKKLNLNVAHLEAGLRSFDRTMPEELNRVVVDAISDLLWTPSRDGDENLLREGVPSSRIERVGNIMIDAFEMMRDRIALSGSAKRLGLTDGEFGVLTLHRPSNVDEESVLRARIEEVIGIAKQIEIVFPLHPRTRAKLQLFGLERALLNCRNIRLTEPLPYIDFMGLVTRARFVVTDSGGIQEETTYLGIPCLTMRPNTERPITVTEGSNRLVADGALPACVDDVLGSRRSAKAPPDRWDGRTAERIAASLKDRLNP